MLLGAEAERGGGGRLGGGNRLFVTVLCSGGRGSLSSMDMSPKSGYMIPAGDRAPSISLS
jgi:hypothetical protein